MVLTLLRLALLTTLLVTTMAAAEELKLDETPAGDSEWGYHPAARSTSMVTPPAFSWRPQSEVESWEVEVYSGEQAQGQPFYTVAEVEYDVHCPPRTFPAGTYTWRYRGHRDGESVTNWSATRTFSIAADAHELPLPAKPDLLARIPQTHPRLFVRPEQMAELKARAQTDLKLWYDNLVERCDKLLADPPPTAEPEKYPAGAKSGSDPWRKIWWGNRTYTIKALDGAATLAFTRLLGGNPAYGELAKQILLDCAKWDPKGATGYRYNDEAGMPYNYHFCRTYTFVNDLLTATERETCRQVIKIRGDEMYHHLNPRHLWKPYSSHSNRAWHFLGELGIAFHGEVEGADDWAWFAANVFCCTYPVWSDDDGGWHEGSSYWSSYIGRFTWWADIMRAALGIDAYQKPYFAKIGDYPLYLMPPGKVGGGFGDLTASRKSGQNVSLMAIFAAQAGNPYWEWYVDQQGGVKPGSSYVDFLRGALPPVEAKSPAELPQSKWFRGTVQAYLNSTILDAADDVQVVFKSSAFGTQSHGYESNNSFLLWAYGQRLLIRSGYRDSYGSDHHRHWMWTTRSVNNITVDGHGQVGHSSASDGQITVFATTPTLDLVAGEAGPTYRVAPTEEEKQQGIGSKPLLDRYTRTILFAKPELMVVFDRLVAKQPATYEYWLHALSEMQVPDQHRVQVKQADVVCDIDFLAPAGLTFRQTDQYDPNPRPRIKLREWHLTATTPEQAAQLEFVTLYRPHRGGESVPTEAELTKLDGGYALRAKLTDGELVALLPTADGAQLEALGLRSTGQIVAERRDATGKVTETVREK